MSQDPTQSKVDRSIKVVLNDPENSASRRDGISACIERKHRLHGTSLLASASRLLKLNASTHASSCVIFHRYCHQVSLKQMDVWSVAMASSLIACKLEEETRPIRQIILIYSRIYRKRRLVLCDPVESVTGDRDIATSTLATTASLGEKIALLRHIHPMSPFGPIYREWYNQIIDMETKVLRQLGFTLYWIPDSHPHKFLIFFVEQALDPPVENRKSFCRRAWNYCNDSFRLDLCLRYPPELIACTAVILAAVDCQIDLSLAISKDASSSCVVSEGEEGATHMPLWWHMLIGDTRDDQLSVIGNALLNLQRDNCLQSITLGFLVSMGRDSWNDPDSYLWSVGD